MTGPKPPGKARNSPRILPAAGDRRPPGTRTDPAAVDDGGREFDLAGWRVRPSLNRLERRGQVVQLEPRVMALLVCLAEKPGRVWTREELFARVWDGRILSDKALTNTVSELRRGLGRDRKVIETIRKSGYRLIWPAEEPGFDSGPNRRTWTWMGAGLAAAVLIAALAMLWLVTSRTSQEALPTDLSTSLTLPRRGRPNSEAIRLLTRFVAREPHPVAYTDLAHRLYLQARDEPVAEPWLRASGAAARTALLLDDGATDAIRQLVVLETEGGQGPRALILALQALERWPADPELRFALSYVYRYAGKLDESARECETAASLGPMRPTLRSCAVTMYRRARFDRAREFLESDYGSQWAWHQEAVIRLHEGRRDAAALAFRRLPEGSPYYGLLEACSDRRESSRAVEALTQLAEKIDDPEAVYETAVLLAACDEPEAALQALERSIGGGYCAASALESEAPFAAVRRLDGAEVVLDLARRCQRVFELES